MVQVVSAGLQPPKLLEAERNPCTTATTTTTSVSLIKLNFHVLVLENHGTKASTFHKNKHNMCNFLLL
jgi:hypothetical protein